MNHAARNVKGLRATIIAAMVLVIIAVWQFYVFVSFKKSDGTFETQGGHLHLWIAVLTALLACVAGFFIFSVFLRRDREDELHINSAS